MRVVPIGSSAVTFAEGQSIPALTPGEFVKVKMRDGSTFEIALTGVSSSELQGVKSGATGPETINLIDVQNVERKQFDALKTTLLVFAIVAGIYFVAQALLVSKILGSS